MKFSWYYVDIINEDGCIITIIFYRHPFFLTFEIGLLDVVIYKKNRKFHWGFPAPLSQCQFRESPFFVAISNSYFTQSWNEYQIRITEPTITALLQFSSQYINWQPRWIPLFKQNSELFEWIIFVPAAKVVGEIVTKEWRMRINGHAYIDSNRTNFLINNKLDGWGWGRFSSKDITISFGSLAFKDGRIYQPTWIISEYEEHLIESVKPIRFTPESIIIPALAERGHYCVRKNKKLDEMYFLMSAVPMKYRLMRKIHEYIFYQLGELSFTSKLTKLFANVKYERRFIKLLNDSDKEYIGLLENMRF